MSFHTNTEGWYKTHAFTYSDTQKLSFQKKSWCFGDTTARQDEMLDLEGLISKS